MQEKIKEVEIVNEEIIEESKEININEILKVEQSPKIFEDLEKIGTYLDKTLECIEDIECTEQNKQEVKKKRASINNAKTILENKRKEIKKIINEPYEIIERKYNELVKGKLDNAIKILDDKTSFIENEQKNQIKEMCVNFFNEYATSKNIDFISFDQMNLKIALNLITEKGALKKKTQDNIAEFIDQREKDLNLINSLEFSNEILIEYKKNLSSADAIAIVMDRHKQLEQIQQQKEKQEEKNINDEEMLEKIDSVLSAPKIEDADLGQGESKQKNIAAFEVISDSDEVFKAIILAIQNSNSEFRQLVRVGDHYE